MGLNVSEGVCVSERVPLPLGLGVRLCVLLLVDVGVASGETTYTVPAPVIVGCETAPIAMGKPLLGTATIKP